MPEWIERILITMAMVSGIIAMLIKNYGGAWMLFTMVLIYLILCAIDAIAERFFSPTEERNVEDGKDAEGK